jgi:hypothetical protein
MAEDDLLGVLDADGINLGPDRDVPCPGIRALVEEIGVHVVTAEKTTLRRSSRSSDLSVRRPANGHRPRGRRSR